MKLKSLTLTKIAVFILGLVVVACGDDKSITSSGKSDGSVSGPGDGSVTIATGTSEPFAFRAILHGKVTGTELPEEVGFEYCYNSRFRDSETGRIAGEGVMGDYNFEIIGLVDQMKIYYRAYMIVDDVVYYGKTNSFNTAEGTYTVDGTTFRFIKVDGEPNGSFSMMQTELPPDAEIEIDGLEIGKLNLNGDNMVTKGELRDFIARTNILFRAPTAAEWKFAASGGFLSKGYTYSGSNNLNEVGWYTGNASGSHRRPGQKKSNELGFYDMSGNYSEFVADFTPAQLEDLALGVNSFKPSIKEVSAVYFNTTWAGTGNPSWGGNWTCAQSKCTISSTEPGLPATNSIDGDKYTFRLVYSRPTNGEEDVTTGTDLKVETVSADPQAYSAMLEGRVTGPMVPDEVGFEYSYGSEFKTAETATVSVAGVGGTFRLQAKNIVDLATIYYRAYAKTDGEVLYGETKSFETQQGTFVLDGKTYKFIKVTGLPTGSFSMMQVELTPSGIFELGERSPGSPDINGNGEVTKGEMREFLSSYFPSGILRAPTPTEWKFAARGGLEAGGYEYSGSDNADDVAWFADNSNGRPHDPALKKANPLGFYDMSGNYAEFCADFNDDQLWECAQRVRKFVVEVKDVPAEVFNQTWSADGGAYGGNWSSSASACTIESWKSRDNSSINKYDAKSYTYRFVYSRPD